MNNGPVTEGWAREQQTLRLGFNVFYLFPNLVVPTFLQSTVSAITRSNDGVVETHAAENIGQWRENSCSSQKNRIDMWLRKYIVFEGPVFCLFGHFLS